jgi:hypothetical protein
MNAKHFLRNSNLEYCFRFHNAKNVVKLSLNRAKMSVDTNTAKKRLDAEQVTLLAENFLSRMGYRRATLHPKKATIEGEKYLIEVTVKKRTATVQVDLATGEIKGFQIEESTESGGFPLSKRTQLLIGGISAIAIVVVILKVAGILAF